MKEAFEMVPGLGAEEIDERLQSIVRAGEICKRVLAFYLYELKRPD